MSKTNVSPLLTVVTNPVVHDLLEKNHHEHDIFFSPFKLHNHFPHVLLTLYSFGANDERLKIERENEEPILEKMLERKPEKITLENWREHLGDMSYYPNYLDFFDNEVRLRGNLACLYTYGFDKDVLPLLFEGYVHSVIHLGYGIEYDQPLVVAESLAEAVVHPVDQTKDMLDLEGPLDPSTQLGESKLPLDILHLIYEDKSLNISYEGRRTIPELITPPLRGDRTKIKQYANMWKIKHDPESVNKAVEDLFVASFHLYATTVFHPTDQKCTTLKLDFFLLHVLTSMLAVRTIVPYLSIPQAVLLLKTHWAMSALYYVARGKPRLAIERLRNYQTSFPELQKASTWKEVHDYGMKSKDFHYPKVLRTMEIGYELYEKNKSVVKDTLWFKSCIVTVEQMLFLEKKLCFDWVGLIEYWA